jgi:hypothetical protein
MPVYWLDAIFHVPRSLRHTAVNIIFRGGIVFPSLLIVNVSSTIATAVLP